MSMGTHARKMTIDDIPRAPFAHQVHVTITSKQLIDMMINNSKAFEYIYIYSKHQPSPLSSRVISPFSNTIDRNPTRPSLFTTMGAHPDADLHPVATGPAKAIVDAHQDEQPLKLYSGWL